MKTEALVENLKTEGVLNVVGVPCSSLKSLIWALEEDGDIMYLAATSEGEAVAIAAGIAITGQRTAVLMQNSGLGNTVNPVTSLLNLYQIPLLFIVSRRGVPGAQDQPQHEFMGEITYKLLGLLGMREWQFRGNELDFPNNYSKYLVIDRGQLEGEPPQLSVVDWLMIKSKRFDLLGFPKTASDERTLTRAVFFEEFFPKFKGPVAAVCSTGKIARHLWSVSGMDEYYDATFYMAGSMGCASGFGLGVALGSRMNTIVFDGDGALLMKLGTMATIGSMSIPKSFVHVVLDNGSYDSTGGQYCSSRHISFGGLAKACGYDIIFEVDTVEGLREICKRTMPAGATLIHARMQPGSPELPRPDYTPIDMAKRFSDFVKENPQ